MGLKREVVVEIEQVRRVRKRVSSQMRFCVECGRHVDFITLRHATELFEREPDELVRFIRVNSCHTQQHGGDIQICLIAFLGAIETATNNSRIRMIGDMRK